MDNIARALKVFVIAGGIVLLAGAMLLVVLIVLRPSTSAPPTCTRVAAADPPAALCDRLPVPGWACRCRRVRASSRSCRAAAA